MSATNQMGFHASVATAVGQGILLGANQPIVFQNRLNRVILRSRMTLAVASSLRIQMFDCDWDGPDDPQNPKNWSYRRKWGAVIIMSSFSCVSSVSSCMIAPATGQVASSFGIDNDVTLALTTSIFVLAYDAPTNQSNYVPAMGPLVLGPLSEIYGRSRVLQLANLWYLVWNLVCGFAQSESQLLAFRFLAGLGGSAPLAIGGGFLGDCWRPDERGRAVAIYSLAPIMGPVLGPITGAWVAQYSTWRWVPFKSLECFRFKRLMRPSYWKGRQNEFADRWMLKKASHREIRTVFEGQDRSWRTIMAKSLSRPFALFAHEPIVQLLGVYMAYIYGSLYLSVFLTTIPSIFQGIYQQPVGIAGLHYIALGIGLIAASQLNAKTMDKIYIYLKSKHGGVGGRSLDCCTISCYGSRISTASNRVLDYLVLTLHISNIPHSALAAVSCLRTLAGFGFPLFAPAMYKALGFGNGNTILAVAAILIGCPAPFIFWHYGEQIRNSSRYTR
ncbi:MFS polyamine transporter [Suillus subalutaceus]|uniref:MFS polyamine transporter n=1 Tax=Suillus subalutaceus TaxID=48586 RepID=UPI001B87CFA5|nr:MFS polyamine transporter [Suillus subalutaceus]KAG1839999.1 MFS polyamine transporter [Suillus subalutaceus]